MKKIVNFKIGVMIGLNLVSLTLTAQNSAQTKKSTPQKKEYGFHISIGHSHNFTQVDQNMYDAMSNSGLSGRKTGWFVPPINYPISSQTMLSHFVEVGFSPTKNIQISYLNTTPTVASAKGIDGTKQSTTLKSQFALTEFAVPVNKLAKIGIGAGVSRNKYTILSTALNMEEYILNDISDQKWGALLRAKVEIDFGNGRFSTFIKMDRNLIQPVQVSKQHYTEELPLESIQKTLSSHYLNFSSTSILTGVSFNMKKIN